MPPGAPPSSAPPKAGIEPVGFTVDGSARLEQRLARVCEEVLQDVRKLVPGRRLEGILLGGGYGRGEGGVLKTEWGDEPYNDLEFYVCLRGHPRLNELLHQHTLTALAHMLSPVAGVEIEFKIMSLARLRRSPVSMFSYDLVRGHRWLLGDDRLLSGCERHCLQEHIPLHEATRLLMNRCAGLLFARQRIERTPLAEGDADFIGRNLAKAQLGFGDAVLAALGQYHWSCRERGRRLLCLPPAGGMPWLRAVQRHHVEGTEFKLHPTRAAPDRSLLQDRLGELTALGERVWLWLESRRLGCSFASVQDYALNAADKCPESSRWLNLLINFRTFGWRGLLTRRFQRYPRERLLNALALLLWKTPTPGNAPLTDAIRRELLSESAQPAELASAYERLWRRFR